MRRRDYDDAIPELLPYIPPKAFAVLLGQVLAGAELSECDRDLVAKIHEQAGVSRARSARAAQAGFDKPALSRNQRTSSATFHLS